jgi:hypothetical protein
MGWVFAISSMYCVLAANLLILQGIDRHYDFRALLTLLVEAFHPVVAIIFGVAWWTILKDKPSARGWGITASLIFVLTPLWAMIYSASFSGSIGFELAIGFVGLLAFFRPYQIRPKTDGSEPGNILS